MHFKFGRQLGCAVIAFIALAAVALTPTPASAGTREFRMITFNFCGAGSDCTNQTADHRATTNVGLKVNELANQIAQYHPDVVLLQELCHSQLESLVAATQGGSWPMTSGTTRVEPHLSHTVLQGFGVQEMRTD